MGDSDFREIEKMAFIRALSGNGGGNISTFIYTQRAGTDLGSGITLDVSDNSKEYLVGIQRTSNPTTDYYSAAVKKGNLIVYDDSLSSAYNKPTLSNGTLSISYASGAPYTNVLLVTITP